MHGWRTGVEDNMDRRIPLDPHYATYRYMDALLVRIRLPMHTLLCLISYKLLYVTTFYHTMTLIWKHRYLT